MIAFKGWWLWPQIDQAALIAAVVDHSSSAKQTPQTSPVRAAANQAFAYGATCSVLRCWRPQANHGSASMLTAITWVPAARGTCSRTCRRSPRRPRPPLIVKPIESQTQVHASKLQAPIAPALQIIAFIIRTGNITLEKAFKGMPCLRGGAGGRAAPRRWVNRCWRHQARNHPAVSAL